MKLKFFIIVSLLVHIVGGIGLYFYYNPIVYSPQSAEIFQKEEQNTSPVSTFSTEQEKNSKFLKQKKIPHKPSKTTSRSVHKGKRGLKRKKQAKSTPKVKKVTKKVALVKKTEPESQIKNPSQNSQAAPSVSQGSAPEKSETSAHQADTKSSLQSGPQEVKAPPVSQADPSVSESFSPEKPVASSENQANFTNSIQSGSQEAEKAPIEEAQADPVSDSTSFEKTEVSEDQADSETSFQSSSQKVTESPSVAQSDNSSKTLKVSAVSLEDINTISPSSSEDPILNKTVKKFKDLKQKGGNPPLHYPDFARRGGMQGEVSVLFFVTSQGLVDQIQLKSSSGYSELDNFVLRTLSRYEFVPGQETWVRYNIPFILEGQETEHMQLRHK